MAEANLTARQDFAPSCPAGGTWWACGYGTYFVGCCARDPCEITCAQRNLYPGAFKPSAYGTFPDATCGTGSKFWTCTAGGTFWGCCKTNACAQSGCPDGDLEPAILNRDDQRSAYHATGASTSSSTPTNSIAPSPATHSKHPDNGVPVAAIAGGAAGGAFALASIVGLMIWCLCIRRRNKAKRADHDETSQAGFPGTHVRNKSADDAYFSATPQNGTYTAAHHFAPAPAPPQELAPTSPSTTPKTPAQFRVHKSMYGHVRGPSELRGDEAASELETGVGRGHAKKGEKRGQVQMEMEMQEVKRKQEQEASSLSSGVWREAEADG
ncbi:uncharacterized protein SETTUDRAFT_35296 [Exserohilum turcica Et28A]|uniref:Uncharacterized protein n=1 Tax=Exserohilum turcicum (strain 28A) TaxID=671987 RepID=R0I7M8_EXST2|nr:uncharacterized protein SETTUDRAFT_35296 [Exserohilum turcica Et28A]EOA81461.1 hypothetical protein SETTUDRAFT_35296 [Exserohilum turcica Et28A]